MVDSCIGPNVMRALLKMLRAPYAVESADVDDALLTLAEGRLAKNEKKSFFEVFSVIYWCFFCPLGMSTIRAQE